MKKASGSDPCKNTNLNFSYFFRKLRNLIRLCEKKNPNFLEKYGSIFFLYICKGNCGSKSIPVQKESGPADSDPTLKRLFIQVTKSESKWENKCREVEKELQTSRDQLATLKVQIISLCLRITLSLSRFPCLQL